MFTAKKVQVRIIGSNFQIDGNLMQFSERECTVLTDGEPPVNSSVTIFVRDAGLDLRLRGTVRGHASKYLVVDLKDLRRGDRRLLDYLFTLAE